MGHDDICLGLRLNVPFWCSFRDPLTSNVHRTFPVPPPSTLYGLIAAAIGLEQDDVSRRTEMRFAIAIEHNGELVETYSKWMKAAEGPKGEADKAARESMRSRGLITADESVWISTPLVRQKIIQPVFIVGILCAQRIADEIASALQNPVFPLYLGESDDVVDIEILGVEYPQPTSGPATGVVSGVHSGGQLANLPCRFNRTNSRDWKVASWLVTVPTAGKPISTPGDGVLLCHGHSWHFEPPALSSN